LINQRRYDLAEVYGRIHLDNLDRDAVLLVASDDAGAICSYLQSVRKIRPDVVLVLAARLGLSTASGEYWYLERLIRDNPFLKRPDLEGTRRKVGEFFDATHAAAAFLNENLDGGRPLFTAILPSSRVARRDLSIVPAGALWKVVPQGREHPDLRYWRQPISAADVLPRYRRERGQIVTHSQHDTEVKPEAYEHRLFKLLVQSQIFLARLKMSWGDHGAAAEILRKVVDLSPETRQNGELLCALGRANYGLGEIDAAERLFLEVLRTSSDPGPAAESFLFLGWIHRKRGNESEAQRCWKFALQVEGIEPRLREEIEKAVRRP
jgi:tetratricopeptide (TPR) repeat protein